MKKIILIRHGQTEWALKGKHTGKTDIPLTEEGQKQAKDLAQLLKRYPFSKAFVSPLQRAKKTFELCETSTCPTFDPDLKEWDYGQYEGMTTPEIREINPGWSIFSHGAPGGESIQQIEERADRMLEKAKACQEDVAFFSSGHILRAIASRWFGQPVSFGKHLVLSTASLSVLGYERENPALLVWNNTLLQPI